MRTHYVCHYERNLRGVTIPKPDKVVTELTDPEFDELLESANHDRESHRFVLLPERELQLLSPAQIIDFRAAAQSISRASVEFMLLDRKVDQIVGERILGPLERYHNSADEVDFFFDSPSSSGLKFYEYISDKRRDFTQVIFATDDFSSENALKFRAYLAHWHGGTEEEYAVIDADNIESSDVWHFSNILRSYVAGEVWGYDDDRGRRGLHAYQQASQAYRDFIDSNPSVATRLHRVLPSRKDEFDAYCILQDGRRRSYAVFHTDCMSQADSDCFFAGAAKLARHGTMIKRFLPWEVSDPVRHFWESQIRLLEERVTSNTEQFTDERATLFAQLGTLQRKMQFEQYRGQLESLDIDTYAARIGLTPSGPPVRLRITDESKDMQNGVLTASGIEKVNDLLAMISETEQNKEEVFVDPEFLAVATAVSEAAMQLTPTFDSGTNRAASLDSDAEVDAAPTCGTHPYEVMTEPQGAAVIVSRNGRRKTKRKWCKTGKPPADWHQESITGSLKEIAFWMGKDERSIKERVERGTLWITDIDGKSWRMFCEYKSEFDKHAKAKADCPVVPAQKRTRKRVTAQDSTSQHDPK